MTFNLMIAGVGGQGTVLASKLIAAAAMKRGFDVRTTETIGMAQRGGSVFGHCRIGEKIYSPLIPIGKADALIAFEPAEAARQMVYLRKDATVIACNTAIKPVTDPKEGNTYEADAMLEFLKTNASKLVMVDVKRLIEDDAQRQNAQLSNSRFAQCSSFNPKTLNVLLLGAAVQSGIFPFDAETLKSVFSEMLPQRFLEMNLKAFELGRSLC